MSSSSYVGAGGGLIAPKGASNQHRTLAAMSANIQAFCSLAPLEDCIQSNAFEWADMMLQHAKEQKDRIILQNAAVSKKKTEAIEEDALVQILKSPKRRTRTDRAKATTKQPSGGQEAESRPGSTADKENEPLGTLTSSSSLSARMTRSRANQDQLIKPQNPFAAASTKSKAKKKAVEPEPQKASTVVKKDESQGRKRKSSEAEVEDDENVAKDEGIAKRRRSSRLNSDKLDGAAAEAPKPSGAAVPAEEVRPSATENVDDKNQNASAAQEMSTSAHATPGMAKSKRGLSISKKSLASAQTSSTPSALSRSFSQRLFDAVGVADGDEVTRMNTQRNAAATATSLSESSNKRKATEATTAAVPPPSKKPSPKGLRQSTAAVSSVEALRSRLESVGAKRQSTFNASVDSDEAPAVSADEPISTADVQVSTDKLSNSKPVEATQEAQSQKLAEPSKVKDHGEESTGKDGALSGARNKEALQPSSAQQIERKTPEPVLAKAPEVSTTPLNSPTKQNVSRLPQASPGKPIASVPRSPGKQGNATGSTWTFGAKIKGFFGLQAMPQNVPSTSASTSSTLSAIPTSTSNAFLPLTAQTATSGPFMPSASGSRNGQPGSVTKKAAPGLPQLSTQQSTSKASPKKQVPASTIQGSISSKAGHKIAPQGPFGIDAKKRANEADAQVKNVEQKQAPVKKMKPSTTAYIASSATAQAGPARPVGPPGHRAPVRPNGGVTRPNMGPSAAGSSAKPAQTKPSTLIRPSASTTSMAARPQNAGASKPSVQNEKKYTSPAVIANVRPPPITRQPTSATIRAVNTIMNASVRPPPQAVNRPGAQASAVSSMKSGPVHPQSQHTAALPRPATTPSASIRKPSATTPKVPRDEDIVLPDVASEYSVSDDEETIRRRAAAPEWAKGQALHDALRAQATMDPDEIFGVPMGPVPIEEMFPTSQGIRRRPRSSSGNWSGKDGLKQAEIDRYNLRMGIGSSKRAA